MPTHFAARITLPFSDLSGAVRAWSLKCDKLLCYEHLADEKVNRTHCHLLMMYTGCTAENLKTIMKEYVDESKIEGGNSFWSFKTKSKKHGAVTEETAPKYIVYMSKGVYDAKYVKGYEASYLDERKAAWVQPEEVMSKAEQEYELFEEHMYYYCRDHIQDPELMLQTGKLLLAYNQIDVLVRAARAYAFAIHKRVWTVQTARMAKSICITYAMRHGIQVPEDKVKVW